MIKIAYFMNYKFLLMSQKDMLKNEVLEEVLRERSAYYFSKSKIFDFWIILSPKLLEIFQEQIQLTQYFSTPLDTKFNSLIISSNSNFINWLKLRIGDFIDITDKDNIHQQFTSQIIKNGVYGHILHNINPYFLVSQDYILDSKLMSEKYKKLLEII